ncbi:MAG: ABC transporter substrate-binding protein [Chloroflexota bacterium]
MSHWEAEFRRRLLEDALAGRITRRQVLKRAGALGLSASFLATVLAACSDDGEDDELDELVDEMEDGDEESEDEEESDGEEAEAAEGDDEEVDIADPEDTEDLELEVADRNRTLIVMQGGSDGENPDYANFNNQVPGQQDGAHSGAVQTMFEPLIMFNVLTGDYENWLAEDWEYNDDFTEITMTLREGIAWSDGEPFTAEDVEFTFNIVRDHQDEVVHGAEIGFLEEAVADDERTIRFVLNQSNPRWWATTLTSNHGVTEQIFPKHIWEDKEFLEFTFFDEEEGWPIGTGPYELTRAEPGQKVFDLRDSWWAAETGFKEMPQIERVIYIPDRDESLSAQMLISNQIDMSRILSVQTLESVFEQNDEVLTFSGQEPPYGYLDWCPIDLGFNNQVEPWSNRDIRWAINCAIDRERLVNLAEAGAGVVARHQFTPYEWFEPYEEALEPLYEEYGLLTTAQPDRTEELMTGQGYELNGEGLWEDGDGNTVQMNIFVPEYLRPYGPGLTQMLRDGGFDAEFDLSPGLVSEVQTGEHPVALGCKGPSGVLGMDPYFMLSVYTSQYVRETGEPAPTAWATARWENEEYDEIVAQMETLDVEDPETLDLFTQAMDIWIRELPQIFMAQLIIRYPMSSHYWEGWPTEDDVYGFPHSWQQEFMKTIVNLRPTQ